MYQPRSDQELEQIKRVVQTALGLNATRGDQIEVVNMPFQTAPELPNSGGPLGGPGGWLDLVGQYGGRALLVVMLAILVLVFKKNLSQAIEAVFHPATPAKSAAARTEEGERFDGMPEMTDQMIEDVREYASENPERVAEVVQSWLHEPERSNSR
jgi:flagellar M-ring protein FliF